MKKIDIENLATLSLEDIQNVAYEILCDFDAFCKKHQLQYYLAFGTLLGAMRHKGFIPWDDDIDIYMLEKDYQRFTQLIAQGHVISENLSVLSDRLSKDAVSPFSKVFDQQKTLVYETDLRNPEKSVSSGVWIDIFPLINLPKNKICSYLIRRILSYSFLGQRLASRNFVSGKSKKATLFRLGITPICRFLGSSFFNRLNTLTINFSQRYLSLTDELITPDCVDIVYSQAFFAGTRSTHFNDRHFPIPSEAELVLEKTYFDSYKNLMTPPPKHLRVRHKTQAYWR